MYILLQKTISNILKKQYVQFQDQCGNITFSKIKNMQLCMWHFKQIWDFENCECIFFKSQISAETCTDSPVKTQTAQHSQNTYVEICAWLNLKKYIWKKMHSHCPESHIFQSVTYIVTCSCFWKCDVHKLLLEMNMLFERGPFFWYWKNISFFWWCYLIFYTFLCCGYLWYLC